MSIPPVVDPLQMSQQAVLAALADEQSGFNPTLASIAPEYAIMPFPIDWKPGSGNFMFAQLDPEMIQITQWITTWPAVTIFTPQAEQDNEQKFTTFSGIVALAVDVWLRFQALKEIRTLGNDQDASGNYEKTGNAALASIHAVLRHSKTMPLAGVNFIDSVWAKAPCDLEGDGWAQRCTLVARLRVSK